MRKHICIVSEESVFAHNYRCGVGEVVDTLAEALRQYYDVTVVTIGQSRGGRLGGLVTMGPDCDFYSEAAAYINDMKPDLVHNFARPDLIHMLTVDCPKILTFDRWEEDVAGYLDLVPLYDHAATLSQAYAAEMVAAHPEAAGWPLLGITNGISGAYYFRANGLFGDQLSARRKFYRREGREDTAKRLIVSMGRLKAIKGIDRLIREARAIAATGAELVVWGTGVSEYMQQLKQLHEEGVLIYHDHLCDWEEMMLALHAADFYLMPSASEVCGLQAMKAARVGCVPIVTPVGGLGENFDESTAIIIDGSIAEAVGRALALTEPEYNAMVDACMAGEWTWSTRVLPWVELYGLPTAPKEQTQFPRKTASVKPIPFAKKETDAKECPFAKKEDTEDGE